MIAHIQAKILRKYLTAELLSEKYPEVSKIKIPIDVKKLI